jgi:hypothetical protein
MSGYLLSHGFVLSSVAHGAAARDAARARWRCGGSDGRPVRGEDRGHNRRLRRRSRSRPELRSAPGGHPRHQVVQRAPPVADHDEHTSERLHVRAGTRLRRRYRTRPGTPHALAEVKRWRDPARSGGETTDDPRWHAGEPVDPRLADECTAAYRSGGPLCGRQKSCVLGSFQISEAVAG